MLSCWPPEIAAADARFLPRGLALYHFWSEGRIDFAGYPGYKGGAGLLPFTAIPQFRRRLLMTRRILIGGLLGAVLLLSAGLSQAQKNDATEKAVTALENQWMKSQQTNDPAPLDTLLADSFIGTSEEGKVETKAETIADAKGTKYVDFKYVDFKVQVYGNAAIATGGSVGKETDKSGTRDIKNRWTDTWVKMPSGKWQCVASHVSNVK
jgi:ketosteroid isomerase-like protein